MKNVVHCFLSLLLLFVLSPQALAVGHKLRFYNEAAVDVTVTIKFQNCDDQGQNCQLTGKSKKVTVHPGGHLKRPWPEITWDDDIDGTGIFVPDAKQTVRYVMNDLTKCFPDGVIQFKTVLSSSLNTTWIVAVCGKDTK